jgi:hypothetical protein
MITGVDQRSVTAHHEAGHVVAAVMRGEGELRSVTIDRTDEYLGHTGFRGKPCDSAFVTYAGLWAEARAQWPHPALDGEDDDGCIFGDYVTSAFFLNTDGDGADYLRHRADDAALLGDHAHLLESREDVWSYELEREWPVIQQIATRLLAGEPVDDDEVRARRDRLDPFGSALLGPPENDQPL